MTIKRKTSFIASGVLHLILLGILILGYEFAAPLTVIENTHQQDVISAVVLGDTAKSKILPKVNNDPQAQPRTVPPLVKKVLAQKEPAVDKAAIALKAIKQKLHKDLLTDIKKITAQKVAQNKYKKILKSEAEKTLREQLLAEEIQLTTLEARRAQGVVNKFKALILQSVSQHWLVPTQANKKLVCELMIRLAPGGLVLDVQITKSSGDKSLDTSVRTAVFKSSPLPVPKDPKDFALFRQFVLRVKPENILSS